MSPQAPSSSSVAVLAVEARFGAADEPVADEQRQHVVAVLALRLRDVHLEPVAEAPQRLGPRAVVDQAVEGREQRRPVRHRLVAHVRVREPLALLEANAERAETARLELALGLAPGQLLRRRGRRARRGPRAAACRRGRRRRSRRAWSGSPASAAPAGRPTSGGPGRSASGRARGRGREAARCARARAARAAGSARSCAGSRESTRRASASRRAGAWPCAPSAAADLRSGR